MAPKKKTTETKVQQVDEEKRDFIVLAASATAAVGGASALWPFIDSMNPAADVLSLATIEVDISAIEPGQSITAMWRGKNIFIRRRTAKEVEEAKSVSLEELPHPESDADRTKSGKEEWLVLVGICTHLGCIPLGEKGDFGGWFCPCHGSHYDVSGRIRKGPAPENLAIPKYEFVNDSTIKIG